jgi:hypothetical protein
MMIREASADVIICLWLIDRSKWGCIVETEGRQRTIKRRLEARFQRRGYKPLGYKNLAGFYSEETGKYRPGVWEEMREYKERLVAEKLKDQDFKQDLEATRARLRGTRESREVAWEGLEPLREKKRQEEIAKGYSDVDYSGLWARYVKANDAYSEAKREELDGLRAKYSLNLGWVSWLYHYLDSGQNKPDELMLYWQDVKRDKFGGNHIQTQIYFPLSKRMLKEIAYWIEFEEEKAFGAYYSQISAGGRSPGPSEATRQKWSELAADYDETQKEYRDKGKRPLTQAEFCEDQGISVSKLQRALRWAYESKRSQK